MQAPCSREERGSSLLAFSQQVEPVLLLMKLEDEVRICFDNLGREMLDFRSKHFFFRNQNVGLTSGENHEGVLTAPGQNRCFGKLHGI